MTNMNNKDDDLLFLEMLNNQFIDELKLVLKLVSSIKENQCSNLAKYNFLTVSNILECSSLFAHSFILNIIKVKPTSYYYYFISILYFNYYYKMGVFFY